MMAQAKSLTPADIDKVLAHIAANDNAQRNRAMLLTTVLAGLRVSEVAALTLADVRNADGTIKCEIFLSAERVKHHHARTVFVNQRLQAELAQYIGTRTWCDDEQPLFTTLRGPRNGFTANTMTQHFHYLYKRAGVFGASSHSGRRTFITTLASKGIGVRVLASLAGHKSLNTTMRYIDVNDEMKRNAVECI
jgi:integrase/recombinase XerD